MYIHIILYPLLIIYTPLRKSQVYTPGFFYLEFFSFYKS